MMEGLNQAISELSIMSETGRSEIGSIDSELTHEEASLNEGEVSTESPTTSEKALETPDVEAPHPEERPPPHPMLIDHVLECMFKHFINDASSTSKDLLKDVRNFRLVCKIWRDEVTKVYRRIQAPTVFDRERGYSVSEMRTFLEVMKNSDMIPVVSYRLVDDFFCEDRNQQLLKNFLRTCGFEIVSLYLQFYNHHSRKFNLTGLANVKLEKLKKLEFHYSMVDFYFYKPDGKIHGFVLLLGFLLNSAKTLEDFKLHYQIGININNAPNQVSNKQHLGRVICQGLSNTVKILQLPNSLLDETGYNALTLKGLKLEEFRFTMCHDSLMCACFRENEPTIRKFLEQHTNTMKTFRITGGTIDDSYKIPFPRLNELRFLEMNTMFVNFFSFDQVFPKLQRFDVDRWDGKEELAERISTHFPNITELHISTISEYMDVTRTLQEVFIHFLNLEQLYISMSLENHLVLDADTLFSGVRKAGRKRIKEADFSKEIFMEEQKMPSILNLTKLKKLELNHNPAKGRGRYHLTDFTVYFVFLQMAELKELSLSIMEKITPKYIERLEKKLNLSWIQRDMKPARAEPTFRNCLDTMFFNHLRELNKI